ncbi:MAG: SsrA-binding protein SmpB [Candidatus Omnitrophica bacterium]|nr:SsrA-binding protein SmpB [Candidatus Omnitrophota bacterium]MDE2222348.1 SsrA-binding protein SmpB [Candidatus Omnitrophota bacterium]
MSTLVTNKKAFHHYHFLEKWECGISLSGGEVKSLRSGGASFADAFAHIDKGELYLYNLHIVPYEQASYLNKDPNRPRKLLVHAKELERIQGRLAGKSLTLVPTKIYFNQRGWAKVEIALAQGKKIYDKRADIKKREIKREIDRSVKHGK